MNVEYHNMMWLMKFIRKLCSVLLPCVCGAGVALHAQTYDQLWKQVAQAEEKSLPQTVIQLTGQIYQKGLQERNAPQLLKAYVCRAAWQEELTPDSFYTRLPQLEQWAQTEPDAVNRAILHSLLAEEYAGFAAGNYGALRSRTVVEGDDLSSDIRLWTSAQFIRRVDDCCTEALRDSATLLAASAEAYVPFVELEAGSRFYGHDLYHLLSRRAIEAYETMQRFDADSLVQQRIEGIYTALIAAYKQRPDREDGLVLATLDELKFRHPRISSDDRGDTSYLAALDALIARHGDRPVCAEVYLAKAEYLYRGSRQQQPARALAVCEEAIRRYAKYERINEVRNLREQILRSDLTVRTLAVSYPGDSLALNVSYRNLGGFTLNLYRTDLKNGYDRPEGGVRNRNYLRQHARKVVTRHFDLQPNPLPGIAPEDWPYTRADTVFSLPMPEELGVYVVEVVPDGKTVDGADRHEVAVSRLMPLTLSLPGKQLEVLSLDSKTGHPVPGVTFRFYSTYGMPEPGKLVAEVTTGADGRATLAGDRKIRTYTVAKGEDTYLDTQSIAYADYGRRNTASQENLTLLTDRSLYRPGQTVYVKGIAYEQDEESARVLEGKTYTLSLLDVNRKELSKQEVRTNDFGSFAAEFILPTSCLNGDFVIKAGNRTTTLIRVEEYKRPTFELTFDPVKTAYALGDTVTVTGQVKAYNGAALQELPLAYTLTRGYGIWRGETRPLAADTVQLDAEGRFSIPVALLPEDRENNFSPMAYFTLTATVTSDNGETQSETRTFSASRRMYYFIQELSTQLCKEDSLSTTFRITNADNQLLEMQGVYRLYRLQGNQPEQQPTFEGSFTSGEQLTLEAWKQLPSGQYRLQLSVAGKEDKSETDLLLFSKHDSRLPAFREQFIHVENTEFDAAHPAVLYYGTSFRDAYVWIDINKEEGRIERSVLQLTDSLLRLEYPYQEAYGKGITVSFNVVKNGQYYNQTVALAKREPSRTLDMKWEVFRDHLRPGQQEEWKLVVKTPQGLPAAAEVLATMYDASLDQLFSRHQALAVYFSRYIPYHNWRAASWGMSVSSPYFQTKYWQVPQWMYDHFYRCYPNLNYVSDLYQIVSTDEVSVADVRASNRLFASTKQASVTGAVARDEAMVEVTPLAKLEESAVAEDGAAPEAPAEALQPMEGLRTNFAETAFFYPQLRTNEAGELVFSFTAPESLTRWNFRSYSHTKDMLIGYLEASATTSKEFMLTPNLPRFVRVGDETRIAATINNLTQAKVKGTATLTLFDPLTDKVIQKKKERFSAEAGRTAAVEFAFDVTDHYDLLGVRIVADGGDFSDGEQHVLPVLSNKTFLTETLAMPIRGGETRSFSLDSLFNRQSETATDRRLTVEFTGNPAWLAVQALPALGEPVAEDAISRAVTWYANSLAAYIASSHPRIKTMLEAWKAQGGTKETLLSRLEQHADVKNILLEETPWLTEAQDESEQMARLSTLFDVNTMSLRLASSLNKLREMQDGDGAWSWYPGMRSNRTITQYILSLLVRLPLLTGEALDAEATAMRDRAFDYLHREIREDYLAWLRQTPRVEVNRLSDFQLDYFYLLALSGEEVPAGTREAYNYYFPKVKNELTDGSITRKSQALVILHKAGKSAQAADFAASLREHLIQEDEMGAHFAFLDNAYRWGMMPIPTHVSAMEALRLVGGNDALLEEMKLWLLQQKKTTSWDTPVAAADAVYALLAGGRDWLADQGDVRISLGKEITIETLTDDSTVPGLSYVRKTYTDDSPAVRTTNVTVEKRDQGFAWGAVYAQFLSPMSDLKQHGGELSVDKQLYVERIAADGRKALEPLTDGVRLAVGDILVSRITLRLDRAMDFVQLKDQRAACLEPVNALSGYRFGAGTGYYEEVGDAATSFFFDALVKGVYVLEHRQRVARGGTYEAGIATMQCAYAPEYASHSAGSTLRVE